MIHSQSALHQNPILLTPTFIHAPRLSPDFKGIWFLLEGPVYWGVLGQARQGLGWGRRGGRLVEHGLRGVEGRVGVDAALTGDTVLGTALTVFTFQLLLWRKDWKRDEETKSLVLVKQEVRVEESRKDAYDVKWPLYVSASIHALI